MQYFSALGYNTETSLPVPLSRFGDVSFARRTGFCKNHFWQRGASGGNRRAEYCRNRFHL